MMTYPVVLSIAGSDSGGCAGIQADIKSISACGAFATTAITALTAQNTQGVEGVLPLPPSFLEAQIDAVCKDIKVGAVKIGMLHDKEVIAVVANKLQEYQIQQVVLDPVMVATSGDPLITEEAIAALKALLPFAQLITPNIPEAELLLGQSITKATMEASAQALAQQYQTSVLLKGGHLKDTDQMIDLLYDFGQAKTYHFKNKLVDTKNTHGTGCSLSASIAAYLAQNYSLEKAVGMGINFVAQGILHGAEKQLGKGNGPIDFYWKHNNSHN